MYSYLYQNTAINYTLLHALDGYDEISLTGPTKVIRNNSETMISPEFFGVNTLQQSDIYGGDSIEDAAKIFTQILNGKGSDAQNNVVCANAAMAIATVTKTTIEDSFEIAKESLLAGKAKEKFERLVELSK